MTPLDECLALLRQLETRSSDIRTVRETRKLHGAVWRYLRSSRAALNRPAPMTPEELAWAVAMFEGTEAGDFTTLE